MVLNQTVHSDLCDASLRYSINIPDYQLWVTTEHQFSSHGEEIVR
jgi:hypothetical protein